MNHAPRTTPQRPSGAERFRLIETMRWEPRSGVRHLNRHTARLARSARHFDFSFSEDAFRAEVQAATAGLSEGRPVEEETRRTASDDDEKRQQAEKPRSAVYGPPSAVPHRVRLTLGPGGTLQSETAPLDDAERDEPLRLMRAEKRADSADPFFRHKTTWRRVYRRAFERAQEQGFDEAVLLNERGEVTEATRANLFLEKDGTCYTPPARCGLLPGVGRAARLADGRAEEHVLGPEDLRDADALWLVSALRGVRRAAWSE